MSNDGLFPPLLRRASFAPLSLLKDKADLRSVAGSKSDAET